MKKALKTIGNGAFQVWLIQKRVVFKPIFAVVLLLVVALSAIYPLMNNGSGGMITVAVYADPQDEALTPVIDDLFGNQGLIVCFACDSPEDVHEAVVNGTADAGWVFLPDFQERIADFLSMRAPIVRCIEKENNVYLNLSRERLFTALYESVSREIFVGEMEHISGEKATPENVKRYYSDSIKKGDLIEFRDEENRVIAKEDYMVSPLKGLLAILIFAGGMAAAILCAKDEHSGVYLVVGRKKALCFKLLEIFVPMFDLSLAVYAALAFLGLLSRPGADALLLAAYLLCCTALCFFLSEILRTPVRLSIALLVLILLSIAACPIFLSVKQLLPLSYCMPCYHYLVGEYDSAGVWRLLAYAAICMIPAVVINRSYKRR